MEILLQHVQHTVPAMVNHVNIGPSILQPLDHLQYTCPHFHGSMSMMSGGLKIVGPLCLVHVVQGLTID